MPFSGTPAIGRFPICIERRRFGRECIRKELQELFRSKVHPLAMNTRQRQ